MDVSGEGGDQVVQFRLGLSWFIEKNSKSNGFVTFEHVQVTSSPSLQSIVKYIGESTVF